MHLDPRFFDLMKNGAKTVELRLSDEKRDAVKVGDTVYFIRMSHTPAILKVTVTAIDRFESLEAAYDALDHASIGFRDVGLLEFMERMYALYPDESDLDREVVAFHVKVSEE